MKNRYSPAYAAALASLLIAAPVSMLGQTAQTSGQGPTTPADEEVVELSPFEVSSSAETGYAAATTLAGNRLATELRDIGNAVQVITPEFLRDIGATDNKSLLQYTTNTEVGGVFGNFAGFGDGGHLDESGKFTNPNTNTRVRGLTAADNTRDYFLTDIPWEGYNVDGVDLQRGPNSILFGQGSPGGIINTRTKQASFRDLTEVSMRAGSWGSTRVALDYNKVLLKNELALRLDVVRNDEQYKQDPAFSRQKRIYGAVRYEPSFLKKGGARTILKASIEFGDINSNNPRQLPPNDKITPWFETGTYAGHAVDNSAFNFPSMNKMTVSPLQNQDDNTGVANHGYNRASHNGPGGLYTDLLIPKYESLNATGKFNGTPNEYYQPWIAGSMLGVFGSPAYNFQYNDATQGTAVNWEPNSNHGINLDGTFGTRTGGFLPYIRPGSVASYSEFAKNARLYYKGLPTWQYGVYKDKSLTDETVYDFYNKLLDGPTKSEYQDFRVYNVSLTQTFFHDILGFEAIYNKEWYKSGKTQLITDDSIGIDFNRIYSDGTPDAEAGPYEDGTPNPNVGKAYVGGGGGSNNRYVSDRENQRLTVFADYDFNRNRSSWLTKLIGRHVLTGLVGKDVRETDNRNFLRYSMNDDEYAKKQNGEVDNDPKVAFNTLVPYTFIYLGDSLSSRSSASGADLPNPQVNPTIAATGKVINFDTTWLPSTNPADPTYVDPAGFWYNDYFPRENAVTTDGYYRDGEGNILPYTNDEGVTTNPPGYNTQNNNPANYVGFREYTVSYLDSLASDENRDLNTTEARLTKSRLTSRAFNWQAHFWDNAVTGTWGVRKDVAKAYSYSLTTASASSLASNYNRLNLDPSNYHLNADPDNRLEVTSHAWTVVAHLNQFPLMDKLPILVSLSYNKSTDFQPAAQRVDIYGEHLAAPSGETKDYGILLETKDGKYSLKINKYKTDTINSDSSGLSNGWFIGRSQAWAANWVNRFEFNWTGDTEANAVTNDPNNTQYNYEPAPGETLADAQAREASVIAAWRAWQKSVDPRFYEAWGINLNDHSKSVGSTDPAGFSITEDSTSKGYEFEFNASPIKNWRLTINGSKTTAERKNIGGESLANFISSYVAAMNNGAKGGVGDLRIWWGGAGNTTTLLDWNGGIGSEYNQRRLQEGTNVPELRKWRWNGISNYEFDHGMLKGVNVGAGVRYESSVGIGYEPIAGENNTVTFDISQPYRGGTETNFDLWAGYTRKIWRNVNWSVQLNVKNVGVGNELIAITANPDGSGATYRIRPPQSWMLTNTFRF